MRQKGSAGVVEVVEMLIMAQQHRVDSPDVRYWQCRAGLFGESYAASVVGPGRFEGGIGQQAKLPNLQQGGGAPDLVQL
ncbi:MAG: hypothetical protein JO227_05120 [Acetobacteraceae bacterium]|nr:hypothetical protein [Acetobacteraceae bacterium]